MKTELNNRQKWIDSGYALFGDIGIDALNVEKLSNLVGLSRSSFYHYFKDLTGFEDLLFEKHLSNYEQFGELMKNYEDFDQLFSNEIMEHTDALSFQRQLLINRSIERYQRCSDQARQFTEDKTYELWSKYKNIEADTEEERMLFKSLRDFYFIHYGQNEQDPKDILVMLHGYLKSKKPNP